MKKYAQIIDEQTKACSVGLGTNSVFYESIGMTEMEVEEGYDGGWYVAGYAPVKPQEVLEAETLAQAKAERAEAVSQITVEVDGMIFDGDEKAQERMVRAVLMADSPEETTEWVLHDNTVAIVTAEQLRKACKLAGKAQTVLWTKPYTDAVVTNTEQHYTLE
jgi:hypothetical protein